MTITIPYVAERDIDLLLLEEFTSSPAFCQWFAAHVDIATGDLIEARHSATTPNGETDIHLVFSTKEGLLALLIENKIDAAFQPNQQERYAERAEAFLEAGDYDDVVTVIVAPEGYFGDEHERYEFDARFTYESIMAWFEDAAHLGPRRDYKLALLETAIERGQTGWTLVPDERVTAFWHDYYAAARISAPELAMPVPNAQIPSTSSFIRFNPSELPKGVSLIHKVVHGNVDLQFSGMAEQLDEVHRRYGDYLTPVMTIMDAGKSAVIRVAVPPINMTTTPVAECREVVEEAIHTAQTLLVVYRSASAS
jgi:hypothetical protein